MPDPCPYHIVHWYQKLTSSAQPAAPPRTATRGRVLPHQRRGSAPPTGLLIFTFHTTTRRILSPRSLKATYSFPRVVPSAPSCEQFELASTISKHEPSHRSAYPAYNVWLPWRQPRPRLRLRLPSSPRPRLLSASAGLSHTAVRLARRLLSASAGVRPAAWPALSQPPSSTTCAAAPAVWLRLAR